MRLDVREALAKLPEAQRLALVLVDMHGLPVQEAAAILGVAEGTVKSRCFRGRAAMAELLGLRKGREDPGSRGAQAEPDAPRGTSPGRDTS